MYHNLESLCTKKSTHFTLRIHANKLYLSFIMVSHHACPRILSNILFLLCLVIKLWHSQLVDRNEIFSVICIIFGIFLLLNREKLYKNQFIYN